jgi:ribosomal protein S20
MEGQRRDARIAERNLVNAHNLHADEAVKQFIKNVTDALRAKAVPRIGTLTVREWEEIMLRNVSQESFIKTLYGAFRVMMDHGIGFMEVMCEEPGLMVACLMDGHLDGYFRKWPPRER